MCPSLQIKNLFAILIDSNQDSIRLLEKYDFEKWGHMPRVAEFDGIEVGHLYYGLRIEKC
jgi:phosphinothricin acetyltransferase